MITLTQNRDEDTQRLKRTFAERHTQNGLLRWIVEMLDLERQRREDRWS